MYKRFFSAGSLGIMRLLIVSGIILVSCKNNKLAPSEVISEDKAEARKDSIEFARSKSLQARIKPVVFAQKESDIVHAKIYEDAVDDPAIWVHPSDPAKSTVIGTDKTNGLLVYNLKGEEIHYYKLGRVNNVDVCYNFPLNGAVYDLAAATNRSSSTISIFKINRDDGSLTELNGPGKLDEKLDDVYGICFYHSKKYNAFYVVVNAKNGWVQQWKITSGEEGNIHWQLARDFQLESQPEGMVADNELGFIYIGEEEYGIWKVTADPEENYKKVLISNTTSDNPDITYDIEGLSLYKAPDGKGYLIVSSQGSFSYAIYKREDPNKYIGSFKIIDGIVDGVEETDGLDVCNSYLGHDFPLGLLVVQDGFNDDNKIKQAQNFKYIAWPDIAKAFEPQLIIDTSYRNR